MNQGTAARMVVHHAAPLCAISALAEDSRDHSSRAFSGRRSSEHCSRSLSSSHCQPSLWSLSASSCLGRSSASSGADASCRGSCGDCTGAERWGDRLNRDMEPYVHRPSDVYPPIKRFANQFMRRDCCTKLENFM